MIVVSNSSPIMNLAVVRQLQILKQLYGKVCIPETVSQPTKNLHCKKSGL